LPAVVENLPSWKYIMKKPFSTFSSYIYQADELLKLHNSNFHDQKVLIITGKIGQGKSTFLSEIVQQWKTKEINVGGFIAKAIFIDGARKGYNLINIETNEIIQLARDSGNMGMQRAGKYYFFDEGLAEGKKILSPESSAKKDLVIVDEIGFMELEGKGWAESVNCLMNESSCKMLWVVRETILEDVIKKWNLKNPVVIDISQTTVTAASELISKTIAK
jgi:nucleoside-triphosphatase THEP1